LGEFLGGGVWGGLVGVGGVGGVGFGGGGWGGFWKGGGGGGILVVAVFTIRRYQDNQATASIKGGKRKGRKGEEKESEMRLGEGRRSGLK